MSFISRLIKDIREEYKHKQGNRTTIELMHITRAIRKGNTRYGTN